VEHGSQAVVCLTLAVGLSGIAISGWQINHLDLAPRYAGVLIAITMMFGMMAGVVNPLIVAALTPQQTLYEWHNVFWLTGSVLTFSLVFYAMFGSGERQSWATPRPPPVRIISPSDPLQCNQQPYGTFSPQVRYNPATSELVIPSLLQLLTVSSPTAAVPDDATAPAPVEAASRTKAADEQKLEEEEEEETKEGNADGLKRRKSSAVVEHDK
jgi:hypothetical protein